METWNICGINVQWSNPGIMKQSMREQDTTHYIHFIHKRRFRIGWNYRDGWFLVYPHLDITTMIGHRTLFPHEMSITRFHYLLVKIVEVGKDVR